MPEPWQIGDLARQDLYPDERYMQPPPAIPAATGEGYAGLGGDPSHLATTIKNWWTNQPSWLERAQAENQKTSEAYQRGGMGAIAQQLATDTTEPQELASGFGGNIKGVRPPVAPGALAAVDQYRPPFYSAVEQAVQGAKQNAAPGQQWAGFLRNQPGVKPEEVEALKLGKLFEQPGSVPKEAVLGEIAANRVNVGEVIKGKAEGLSDQQLARLDDLEEAMRGRALTPVEQIEHRDLMLAENAAAGHGVMGATKFQQYTLPGGENYREMLLTLPSEPASLTQARANYQRLSQGRNPDLHPDEFNAAAARYEQEAKAHQDQGGSRFNTFQSSHYDEPNILAHVRYNDRVIDGKKTLFVEEVQSDWHQKGKREGYRSEPSAAENELLQLRHKYDPTNQAALSPAEHARMSELESQVGHGLANKVRESAVPDAPFKTTWPELAMKRIIREAAEKGYDKVAWTPGSVQAERYDLSKHIDKISYDGKRMWAWKKGDQGSPAINKLVKPEELADEIGKEAAERLMQQPEQKRSSFIGGSEPPTYRTLEGADLKIGGEGMKGFYDEILPATVNRLVKKHGGRVTQGEINAAEKLNYQIWDAGDGTFQIRNGAGEVPPGGANRTYYSREGAQDWIDKTGAEKKASVHTLDITPSLRAAAMKGFPLFSAGGIAATGAMGELARQDEYR